MLRYVTRLNREKSTEKILLLYSLASLGVDSMMRFRLKNTNRTDLDQVATVGNSLSSPGAIKEPSYTGAEITLNLSRLRNLMSSGVGPRHLNVRFLRVAATGDLNQ
ncbi:hypothetical protein TNIN_146891 [Trichonephila inaurata madagascariensis]|uniref:Uncharacterized protein n=1 Tax=Trichonephila inaurata madagascariensis TaxID=2747483 RepID=A0A8X6XGY1_9ARAC|nr:hypothetical protein TNIN_146891 [Trichonephila inaurata madagascariensis]